MKKWLAKIQAPKWYRYIFYKLNLISKRLGNRPPNVATVLLLSLTNSFQLVLFFALIGLVIGKNLWLEYTSNNNPVFAIIIFALILERMNFLLFSYKDKWKDIMYEFEEEKKKVRATSIWDCILSFPL